MWYNRNTMSQERIVVVGAAAVDVKAQSFGDLVRSADVPGHARVMVGGVARNVAKNLALLGATVTMVSVVGYDEFGRIIRNDLSRAGVNIDNLIVDCEQRSATWVGVLNATGDLEVGIFDGVIFDALTPAAIRERAPLFANVDLIAVDATLPRATIDAVMVLAKVNRVPIYLNPASVARAQTLVDGVGDFTVVTANALEAQVLTGQSIRHADDAIRAAQFLVQRGVQRTIITLGVDGIVYADSNLTRYAPALPTLVVDTTGAGDALAAMFLLCHLQGKPLDETLALALRAAAITTSCAESVNENIAARA